MDEIYFGGKVRTDENKNTNKILLGRSALFSDFLEVQMKRCPYAFVLLLAMAAASLSLAQVQSSAPAGQTSDSELDPTPTRTENFGALFTGEGWEFPLWRSGSLIRTSMHSEGETAVEVFDDSGGLEKQFRLSVPGAFDAGVFAATALKDGRIVASVRAFDSEGRLASSLGMGDDSSNIKLLFGTKHFVIDQICTGDNDKVWAYGWQESLTDRSVLPTYKALREYDLQKGEVQAVLGREKKFPIAVGVDAVLHCAAGRVFLFDAYDGELFTYETASGAMSKLVTESLRSDKTITSGIVITDSGEVFASTFARLGGVGDATLFCLKRSGAKAQWVPVGSFPRSSRLFASSGDQLILLRSDRFAEFRHIRPHHQ